MDISNTEGGNLLIVDDKPDNIAILFDFLSIHGFNILVAGDGEDALTIMQNEDFGEAERPELILLDIMMPNMNGFETCRRLKEMTDCHDIPIIFMTALSDTKSKLQGFELGAVDYITKPFRQEEVLARVQTHLTLRRLQRNLETRNAELNAFSRTVAHDLKNPLSGIIMLTDLLLQDNENFSDQQNQRVEYIGKASQKMFNIIDSLLLLAGISNADISLEPLTMADITTQVQERLKVLIEQKNAQLILPKQWPVAQGYAPWIEEIWANYLSNGLKYGGQPPQLELGAALMEEEEQVRFWVRDNGDGLSEAAQARLFTPFTRLHQNRDREGHGLGLSIVQAIVKKLGGTVGVESEEGKGSLFYFTLPCVQ